MPVRKWFIHEALASFRRLTAVVDQLTAEEVTACLDLEAGSQRRRSVIDRLIARALQLSTLSLSLTLTRKYHGNSHPFQNHVDR